MATRSPDQHGAPRSPKRRFAKAARNFAKRVAALPGIAPLTIGGGGAIALATITGPFGTIEMPLAERLGLWTLLIGWNVAKWLAWFGWTIRAPRDWPRAAATGSVVVNLPLPLEIPAALWLFGVPYAHDPARVWLEAAAISATLFVVLFLTRRKQVTAPSPGEDGILFRAGVRDRADVRAVRSEDHYCRLFLRDGHAPLVLARLSDVVAELGAVDGARVHRGAWVAAAAIDGALREGRGWRLVLTDGQRIPVGPSHLAAVRARGWLRRKPAPAAKLG